MFDSIAEFTGRFMFYQSPSIRVRFWQRMASLSQSGVPIAVALDFLLESKVRDFITTQFAIHQRRALRTSDFSSAAAGWVPQEELAIIQITQEGRITEGFKQAGRMATVKQKLRATLISGLTYPTILLIGGGTVIAILPKYALSVMSEILDTSKWPAVSRNVLEFSDFVSSWGVVLVGALLGFLVLCLWSAPRWTGTIRRKIDWCPPFNLYRQFCGPEILCAMLALMQAGVQRIRALSQLESLLPNYLASHVRVMRSSLYRGDSVEIALDTGLFSAESLDTLRIYERAGDITSQAQHIAQEELTRALAKLESVTRIISSLMLIAIGGIAIWVYVGIARVVLSLQNLVY